MSEVAYLSACHGAEIVSVADPSEDGQCAHGHWECSSCGAQIGVWMDAGKLDLGEVRAEDLNASNEFQVFAEPPPGA